MAQSPVETRIREVLDRTGDNVAKARMQILEEATRDLDFLYGLTRPHLNGIVAYAIDRVLRKKNEPPPPPPAEPPLEDLPGEDFGKALLKALALGDPAKFGEESFSAQARRGTTSKRHIEALRKMAGHAATSKKKDDRTA